MQPQRELDGDLGRAAGLDVRTISRAGGEIHELVITNPAHPDWRRVVIDREGLMEWDYWGPLAEDAGAVDMAAVIIAIMATRAGRHPQRYGMNSDQPDSTERDRPHP